MYQLRCLTTHWGSFAPDRLHQRQPPFAHAVPGHPYGRAPDDQVLGAGFAPPAERAGTPHARGPLDNVLDPTAGSLVLRRSSAVLSVPSSDFAPAVETGPPERAVLEIAACHRPHGCAEEPLRLCDAPCAPPEAWGQRPRSAPYPLEYWVSALLASPGKAFPVLGAAPSGPAAQPP